jgi:hypothetical protein
MLQEPHRQSARVYVGSSHTSERLGVFGRRVKVRRVSVVIAAGSE